MKTQKLGKFVPEITMLMLKPTDLTIVI